MSGEPSTLSTFQIDAGDTLVMFAYDLGLAVDLEHAQRLLREPVTAVQRESIQQAERPGSKRRMPQYFEFDPPPLRVDRRADPIEIIPGWQTDGGVECTLYDFGALCVTYRVPMKCDADRLLELADALYENAALLADSRARAQALLNEIGAAVTQAHLADPVEDYVIYRVSAWSGGNPMNPTPELRRMLAQILRAERQPLSTQQLDDAMSSTISYGEADLAIIDWNASFVFQEHAADVLAVLEYANIELLELRLMDDRLDDMLEVSYEAMLKGERSRSRGLRMLAGKLFPEPGLSLGKNLRRIAALQMDSALMFEDLNNALKLLGDQYLARVYRLAAQRLHLNDWDASVLRKIQTIDGIYQKANDKLSTRRMEILEWIVIILIALEILLAFSPLHR